MTANRPSAVVQTTPENCMTVVSRDGITNYEAGVEVFMDKLHARACQEPVVVNNAAGEGQKWSGTVAAGEAVVINEFPVGATGLSVETCDCFKMLIGTEDSPLPEAPPKDNPVKENAPCLYDAGEHPVAMTVDGCPVTGVMIINCNDTPLPYQLNFTGC